jgi:hypothetical protein
MIRTNIFLFAFLFVAVTFDVDPVLADAQFRSKQIRTGQRSEDQESREQRQSTGSSPQQNAVRQSNNRDKRRSAGKRPFTPHNVRDHNHEQNKEHQYSSQKPPHLLPPAQNLHHPESTRYQSHSVERHDQKRDEHRRGEPHLVGPIYAEQRRDERNRKKHDDDGKRDDDHRPGHYNQGGHRPGDHRFDHRPPPRFDSRHDHHPNYRLYNRRKYIYYYTPWYNTLFLAPLFFHYYDIGFRVDILPTPYVRIIVSGRPYYYSNGVYYRPHGAGYIVVTAPIDALVHTLPVGFVAFSIGLSTFYFVNDTYYEWDDARDGYVVVRKPSGADKALAEATAGRLYVYPNKGQSEEQQAKDRYECHMWAVSESGIDPTTEETQYTEAEKHDYKRAISACLEARDYTVK